MALVSIGDYESLALKLLPHVYGDYYKSGACEEVTLKNNKESFKRYVIIK